MLANPWQARERFQLSDTLRHSRPTPRLSGRLDIFFANGGITDSLGELIVGGTNFLYTQLPPCGDTGVRQPSPLSSICYRCPSYMTQEGERCIECAPNLLVDNTGECATDATDSVATKLGFSCPAGNIRPFGADECIPCGNGTRFTTSAGELGTCAPCAPGTYSPASGSVLCFDCPLGAHSPESGAAACTSCAVGKYSEVIGASNCSDCPVGGYCATEGAASASMAFEQWYHRRPASNPFLLGCNLHSLSLTFSR